MKFTFPKELKREFRSEDSALFPLIVSSAINETNIQRVIVQLLERLVKNGRVSMARKEGGDFSRHLERLGDLLSEANVAQGLDRDDARSAIDSWLTASIIRWIPATRTAEKKIDFLRPTSAASFLSGFPSERSRLRGIDKKVFEAIRQLSQSESRGFSFFRTKFLDPTPLVDGLDFTGLASPSDQPELGGVERLDPTTLLALKYGMTFPPLHTDKRESTGDLGSQPDESVMAMQNITLPVGKDVMDIFSFFAKRGTPYSWTSSEILSGLEAVIGLRMMQMPIRISKQLQRLKSREVIKVDEYSLSDNDSEMFVDFSSGTAPDSSFLARASVSNDLTTVQNLYPLLVQFKITEKALNRKISYRESLASLTPSARVELLSEKLGCEEVQEKCTDFIDSLLGHLSELNEHELFELVVQRQAATKDDFRTYVDLVLENNGATALSGYRKWFYSTGNIDAFQAQKGVYFLAGLKAKHTTWRYVISDEALFTLVSLCFIPLGRDVSIPSDRMLVKDLMDILRLRFGILVLGESEIPDEVSVKRGSEQNLRAFLERLRLLGCYDGLSDDFEAQYVSLPGLKRR